MAQALLKSKGAGTFEDKARQVVKQMWIRIILRLSQLNLSSQISNFAMLSLELSKLLGMVVEDSEGVENNNYLLKQVSPTVESSSLART